MAPCRSTCVKNNRSYYPAGSQKESWVLLTLCYFCLTQWPPTRPYLSPPNITTLKSKFLTHDLLRDTYSTTESEHCLEITARVDETSNLFPVLFSLLLNLRYYSASTYWVSHYTSNIPAWVLKVPITQHLARKICLSVLNYLSLSLFVAITECQRLDSSQRKQVFSDYSL